MDNPPSKVKDACKELCRRLLESEQCTPANTLFRDDLFEETCARVRNENEARVIKDITWLIICSAEILSIYGATELNILVEKLNSSWLKCIPLTKSRPQPDYSVGFRTKAFNQKQLDKLSPFVGGYQDQCSVMAREDMYFPFMTCEVKCGDQALNVADRQNMHSASVAVKGLADLFRKVHREKDVHQTILAFSISHDNEAVRIYGHYPLITGEETHCYRYVIHKFDITAQDGKEKWTGYKFTKNIYDIFVPIHLERIRSAIDQLPDPQVFSVEPFLHPYADVSEKESQSHLPHTRESTIRLPSPQTTESACKKPKQRGFSE